VHAPVAKAAVVTRAVTPGPAPVAKAAVVTAAVTPRRRRRRICAPDVHPCGNPAQTMPPIGPVPWDCVPASRARVRLAWTVGTIWLTCRFPSHLTTSAARTPLAPSTGETPLVTE